MPIMSTADLSSFVTQEFAPYVERLKKLGGAWRERTIDEERELERCRSEYLRRRSSGGAAELYRATCMLPVEFRAATGVSPSLLEPGTSSYDEALCKWVALSLVTFGSHAAHAEMRWLYQFSLASRFGAPSVFTLSESVASRLSLTDPPAQADVVSPLPSFFIQMPKAWSVEAEASAGFWPEFFLISESPDRTEWFVLISGYPAGGSRDHAVMTAINVSSKSDEADIHARCFPIENVDAYTKARTISSKTSWVRKIVLNFIAYLQSEQANVKPDGANRPWREVREILASNPKRTRVVIGKRYATWHAQDPVGTKPYELTATDILVRGHWRRQVHGEKRALRKLIWVEPFVRRATDAMPAGHDYVVAGAAE